jgi:hypothetical protein
MATAVEITRFFRSLETGDPYGTISPDRLGMGTGRNGRVVFRRFRNQRQEKRQWMSGSR